jgi:branched-chain amino acid transport system permease protein
VGEIALLADERPQSDEARRARLYLAPAAPGEHFRRLKPPGHCLALGCGGVLVSPDLVSTGVSLGRALRIAGLVLLALVIAFPIVWVLFIASDTTFGPAVDDPKDFLITLLNGVTAAALYFIVASGFTLIFGLMRVVNMAHGAFFLLGGYIALELQRDLVPGAGSALGISSAQVSFMNWFLPLLAAGLIVGGVGLLMQQAFLRWNQGQELRQALITIAISIIAADQMLAHFGGVAKDISWPRTFDKFLDLQVAEVQYTLTRIVILGVGLFIGGALWFWLKRTRTGMVIRAGVDDRDMVSALGVNIQLTFAIAFFIGSALAGIGGVMGGSFASLAPGVDGLWLLNSLVVVIIGGMGSLGGAAVGALLLGLTTNFAAAYLPADYTFYSIIFTFVLLAVVLAIRPLGLFGRPA